MNLQVMKSRLHAFMENPQQQTITGIMLLMLVAIGMAHAGTGGQAAFGQLEQQIIGWAQGTLGTILSVVALLVGAGFAVARQSVVFVVIGLSFALVLYFGPNVITGIMIATGGVGMVHPMLMG
jgi:conjugal transfer pilus assembly protein TraA